MPDRRGYAKCPGCSKDRQTTGGGKIVSHNKWTGLKMVPCEGSLKLPAKR